MKPCLQFSEHSRSDGFYDTFHVGNKVCNNLLNFPFHILKNKSKSKPIVFLNIHYLILESEII